MPRLPPEFSVAFLPAAVRDLEGLDAGARIALLNAMGRELSVHPFPRGKLIKRLHGFRIPTYEFRISVRQEAYRAVYRIEGRRVLILMIPSRKELDRHLKRLK